MSTMHAFAVISLLVAAVPCRAQSGAQASPTEIRIPKEVDLAGSFGFRMHVRLQAIPPGLPLLASNKPWESGKVRDYTTNNDYGLGRESGSLPGFSLSVLPDGAWTWNAGDGRARLDHRPEAGDQGIADGRWHEVGFSIDRAAGVAHLYHDGRRVAIHDLRGVGDLTSSTGAVRLGVVDGLEVSNVRISTGTLPPPRVAAEFVAHFGESRKPRPRPVWNGRPLRVLAWNIWHGGRRKGVDEGVKRVVDVIKDSGADLVLMQETYGSGPRISGRLGFDYYLRSSNLSIMSRYPIHEVHRLFSGFRFGGATIELRPGTRIQAYSLWIHHLPDVGKSLENGDSAERLIAAEARTRGREIDAILGELLPHLDGAPSMPVLVGGDFNSGSHLDWTDAAAGQDNHHGRTVAWPVSLSMERAGFQDTFRARHPDPVKTPGFTWSPEFKEDHQDRIDYVYARVGDWRVMSSRVLDHHPDGWPSDHAAVLSTLELKEAAPALEVMSYNIHYAVGMDQKRDLERIAAVIKSQSPDIVGLQEIGDKAMADELSRLTGMRGVFGPAKGRDDAYGDAILCKLPFQWVGNVALPSASSSRYQAMAIDVDVSDSYGPGSVLRFVNTHFDWTDSLGSEEARRAAVRVIERAFFADHPRLAILAGDLNAVPGSPPLVDLEAMGWHLPRLGQPMHTHGAPHPTKQIDYVLVRPALAWRATGARVPEEPVASDHYPVILSLRPVR